MSNKPDKKAAKQQARKLQQLKRQQEQLRKRQQLQRLKQQQDKLSKTSSPLVQYGLLDAYEFFLKHLAQNGIPQPNIFEFAAQAVLKYEKKTKKKGQELKKIQQYNKSVIQNQKNVRQQSQTKKKQIIRPNMLPFKGDINKNQLDILNKINNPSKSNKNKVQKQQNYYTDDQFDQQNQ